jgi:transcription elongation factor Elf1
MGDEPEGTPPGGASSSSRDPRQAMEALGEAQQCPFCGSFSYREFFDKDGRAMCRCNDCGTEFPAGGGA